MCRQIEPSVKYETAYAGKSSCPKSYSNYAINTIFPFWQSEDEEKVKTNLMNYTEIPRYSRLIMGFRSISAGIVYSGLKNL